MNILRKAIVSTIFILVSLVAIAQTKTTREEYVQKYKHIAIDHMERYGIPASITMAQGILESGTGNSVLALKSNNHFGIKCKKGWTGGKVYHDDDAKDECFRSYESVEESYRDHAEFLDNGQRYDSLFRHSPDDYKSWARGLKAAGYATAPDYAERLIKIIEQSGLNYLDQPNGGELYSAFIRGEHIGEEVGKELVAEQKPATPVVTTPTEGTIDPNNYHVTVNAHMGYNVYVVNLSNYILAKEGDTLESIGEKFQVSKNNLRRFNDFSKSRKLSEGEIVFITHKKNMWAERSLTHTVVKGDTLHEISQKYGIRLKSLRKLNKIKRKDANLIKIGQVIKLN